MNRGAVAPLNAIRWPDGVSAKRSIRLAVPGETARAREVAAARRFEQLENWMAVINEAQRAAPAAPRIDRRAKLSRQERRALVGPRAVLAKDDQHTAAALDEACEDAIAERGRKGD